MYFLLSLNYKFFTKSPKEFIHLIQKNDTKHVIDGFEIAMRLEEDGSYFQELSNLCLKNNYILTIHAPSKNVMETYRVIFRFFKYYLETIYKKNRHPSLVILKQGRKYTRNKSTIFIFTGLLPKKELLF